MRASLQDNQEMHCREQILKTFRLICLPIEKAEMDDLVVQGLPLRKPWKKLSRTEKRSRTFIAEFEET